MDRPRAARYILGSKQHRTVDGWLDEGAISAVVAFAGWQEQHEYAGMWQKSACTMENSSYYWQISG
jgi:hypothetical protein